MATMAATITGLHAFSIKVLPSVSLRRPISTSIKVLSFVSRRSWTSLASTSRCSNLLLRQSTTVQWRTTRALSVNSAATHEAYTVTQLSPVDNRVPATVITGFLGAGKTTLLNYVLNEHHGKRIAVIENEFGEVDIDGSLVAAKNTGAEDIIMLSNGCLCCTVRGDLVRMITELVKTRRDKFDHILIETTGLANPSPIIQTFYAEEEILENVKLDGVVTLIDAKHAPQHLDEVKPDGIVNEAVEQIAYADRIILNKIDLVEDSELERLVLRIKNINGLARMQRAKYGKVDIDYVLGIGGFDLGKVESEIKEESPKKEHTHDHHHDPDHKCDEKCEHDHDHDHHPAHDHSAHDHKHDPGISSVSIVADGNLELQKIYTWLDKLLGKHSEDIYRMKGVLAIEGVEQRFVFQSVHSIFEGGPDRLWAPDEKRTNKIVFIGKNLDKETLNKGFDACMLKGQ